MPRASFASAEKSLRAKSKAQKSHPASPERRSPSVPPAAADGAPEIIPISGGGLATLDRIVEQPTEWIVPGLIPRNELVLCVGPSGVGKSTFFARLLAHLTGQQPLGGSDPPPPGVAMLLCGEELIGGVVRERLAAAGADLGRIVDGMTLANGCSAPVMFLPDHLSLLAARLRSCRASVCVVDPITSFLGAGCSPNEAQSARSVLEPLQRICRSLSISIFYTMHYRKSQQGDSREWVSGHLDWWNMPRHILTFGRDPRREGKYIVAVGKPCSGPPGPSRSYRILNRDGAGYWDLGNTVGCSAQDLAGEMEGPLERSARDLARGYLRTQLEGCDQRAATLLGECAEAGFSARTLLRAAADLGVIREFRVESADRAWWWRRPAAWPD